MADANSDATNVGVGGEVVVSAEDVQNQVNENSENTLAEQGGEEEDTGMEVDGGACDPAESCADVVEATGNGDETTVEGEQQKVKGCVQDAPPPQSLQTDDQTASTEGQGDNGEDNGVIQMEVKSTAATTIEGEGGTLLEANAGEGTGTAVVNSVQVDIEAEDVKVGEEGDSYMVLEEADGDDNESEMSDDEDLSENEQLRKANFRLSERLSLLEEFIEVEFSDKFGKFMKKRAHLVDVMGSGQTTDLKCNGKRSPKSSELVGLLKIVNDQARSNGGSSRKYHSTRDNSSRASDPSNPKASASSANSESARNATTAHEEEVGSTDVNPIRCHRCRATGHMVRECPLPIDPRDRRVILKKDRSEFRNQKRERDRFEAVQNPQLKAMRDKRRRLTRAINRQSQMMMFY